MYNYRVLLHQIASILLRVKYPMLQARLKMLVPSLISRKWWTKTQVPYLVDALVYTIWSIGVPCQGTRQSDVAARCLFCLFVCTLIATSVEL